MKKFYFLTVVLFLALAGCKYDDDELKSRLDDVEKRVGVLEEAVKTLNTDVGNLQALINGKLFITAVTENPGGGYTLSLVSSDGKASTMVVKDGEKGDQGPKGDTPNIGVKLDSDGKYYWTLDGEYILVGGNKVPASGEKGENGEQGVTPKFKIDEGIWHVSYDEGVSWEPLGPATGGGGDSFFSDVIADDDWVYLTLAADGTVLKLELYKEFGIAFGELPGLIEAGETAEISFTLTGADDKSVVEAIAKGEWTAEVVMEGATKGKIAVTAPAETSTGRVIVLVSDGGSKTVMKALTFLTGAMSVTDDSQECPAAGGTVTFRLQTDIEDFEVVIPEDAQGWVSYVNTRAMREETLTFTVKPNTTEEARKAEIGIVSAGVVLETLLITQPKAGEGPEPSDFTIEITISEITPTTVRVAFVPSDTTTHYICSVMTKEKYEAFDWNSEVEGLRDYYQWMAEMYQYGSLDEFIADQTDGKFTTFTDYVYGGNAAPGPYDDVWEDFEPNTDCIAFAFAINEQLEPISETFSKEFRTEELTISDDYEKWLGTWTLTGANGMSTTFTISTGNHPGQDYIIDSYWKILQEGNANITTTFNEEDGSMSFVSQDVNININSSYGLAHLHFLGMYDEGRIITGTYPIGTASLTSDTEATVEAESVQVSGGSTVTFTSMDYAAQILEGDYTNSWLTYYWGENQETSPTFPMTMTKTEGTPTATATSPAVMMHRASARMSGRKAVLPAVTKALRTGMPTNYVEIAR